MSPQTLGQSIRQARRVKGITQAELADRLYVTRQTVSNWENARTQPDYEILQRLAEELDVELKDLLLDGEEKDPAPETAPVQDASQQDETEPAAPEVVQPQADAAPADMPAEDEQPRAEAATRRFRIRHAAAALCALLLCVLLAAYGQLPEEPSPDQFSRSVTTAADQALVTLYAKNLRVNRLSGKNHPTWHYKIYLREDHGVGFQMEELRFVRFLADGESNTKVYDAAEIARINQTSHLNGYGLMMFSEGYTPKDSRPSHPTGLGVMLRGKDDSGQAHAFTMYIPFDPYVQP